MSAADTASERQRQAAEPELSTWLSANAGSGKTRVLTDRVARLLLDGVAPQRILCLTYTKAAASEMQNRLFARLGGWAMLDPDALRAALAGLGVAGPIEDDTLARARRLFARAIETPGGLKIQTIHSFCAALLRRFPLEAGITPQFREMDDRAARLLRAEIVEEMADGDAADVVDAVARLHMGEDFEALTREIVHHQSALAAPLDHDGALALFGLPRGFDAKRLGADVFTGGEGALLDRVAAAMAQGSPADAKAAPRLRALAAQGLTEAALPELEAILLYGAGAKTPFAAKQGKFSTKATRERLGAQADALDALMQRVEAARPRRLALAAAERTHALHRFAATFLPEYAARKARAGWLDFDDLILRSRALLAESSVAQWVLFKLDGGIDHILVDEAQDTSPVQWDVIEALTREFTAGEGAREGGRTVFVVGDRKQSIYSFQGADLDAFERMHAHFEARLAQIGTPLQSLVLEHSFRSAQAILRLVDLTFDAERGQGLGGEVKHLAFHADMPGRVDLWPPVPPSAKPEDRAWHDPVDIVTDAHHSAQLAQRIADEIRRMIDDGVAVPDARAEGGARPVHEGDFLVLVQRRSALFAEVIRACKARGLAIAGADRLKLGAEMAVRDLAALLAFLATPEDDLSLAAVLRSPLLGWSEAQLFDLAHGRGKRYLWSVLRARRDDFAPTLALLEDLRDQTDFLRPYELIERVLTRHDGRRRLLARLGPEAEEGMDALLSQALAFERNAVPSLTGFLTWLETEDVEVKRQLDNAGGRIRVMTVHGAKGLESPIVILPDTANRRPRDRDALAVLGAGDVVWKPPAQDSPPAVNDARDAAADRRAAEDGRLLYVAMTRAETWLIVAAAGEVDDPACWYQRIRGGLDAAGAVARDFALGEGLRLQIGDWPAPRAAAAAAPDAEAAALPAWSVQPAPAAVEPPAPVAPSDLGGAKALPGEAGAGDETSARRRGRQLHRLLEHLPGLPRVRWPDLARDLLTGGEDAADAATADALLTEARAVLDADALAFLFAPGTLAEVDIAAPLGAERMLGTIDRLVITPERVLAVDYKSNAVVPDRPEDVPEGLLRQMGAYAQALEQIFGPRRVETALLWTRSARLMTLPHDLVRAALERGGRP